MASRRPAPRVDLSALAEELSRNEQRPGRWRFDGVDQITPKLYLEGAEATSMSPDVVVGLVEHHLRSGAPAWDPYD
jgi:hypothetical protein